MMLIIDHRTGLVDAQMAMSSVAGTGSLVTVTIRMESSLSPADVGGSAPIQTSTGPWPRAAGDA
jgi:hypothetical protein